MDRDTLLDSADKESSCMKELAKGNYERGLPVEKWEQVLKNASPTDLCNVMMTSSYMNSVASHPDLWVDMKVNTKKVNKNGLTELYAINRFKKIKEMSFEYMEFTSEELERILKDIPGTHLENVNFRFVNLSGAPPQLLAKAVAEMKHVKFWNTKLTSQQCEAILSFEANESKLKKLSLALNDLSRVDQTTLAKGLVKLEDVNLYRTRLTSQQSGEIARALDHDSKLKKLSLVGNNLSRVNPNTLARAVVKLEDVHLDTTQLTTQHSDAIVSFAAHDSKLKKLSMAYNNLSQVNPNTLARAVVKTEDVDLLLTQLTSQQSDAIARALDHNSKLKKLSLVDNDLSGVDPNTLARALVKLEDVNMFRTGLTNQQGEAIASIAAHGSKLKKLSLAWNDLSQVDPNNLARAVVKIEDVDLSLTQLTSQQCEAIASIADHGSNLKKLVLTANDISTLDPQFLAEFSIY